MPMYDMILIARLLPKYLDYLDFYVYQNGHTPLHVAAYYNAVEIAEVLIAKGADLNAPDLIVTYCIYCTKSVNILNFLILNMY